MVLYDVQFVVCSMRQRFIIGFSFFVSTHTLTKLRPSKNKFKWFRRTVPIYKSFQNVLHFHCQKKTSLKFGALKHITNKEIQVIIKRLVVQTCLEQFINTVQIPLLRQRHLMYDEEDKEAINNKPTWYRMFKWDNGWKINLNEKPIYLFWQWKCNFFFENYCNVQIIKIYFLDGPSLLWSEENKFFWKFLNH